MELSPYHKELRQDLIDWEMFRAGLDALERISGIEADDAINYLAIAATQEQRERVVRRATRAEEFYNLPPELQAQLKQAKA